MLQLVKDPQDIQHHLAVLQALDRAIVSHTNWVKGLHRTLVCDQAPATQTDLDAEAHRLCQFGQWFYATDDLQLVEKPTLDSIETAHREMHGVARDLLVKRRQGESIGPDEYDRFMDQVIHFKLAIRNLKSQIIEQVCIIDHVTGAWNRHALYHKIQQEFERVARADSQCAICMMDIDHFKQINDLHGHVLGDEVLRTVTDICAKGMRAYDSIFRYGGDEFLLCLPDISSSEANQLLGRLRQTIAATVFNPSVTPFRVMASLGLSFLTRDSTIENAIIETDHALLCAKTAGRDRVCLWDTHMPESP